MKRVLRSHEFITSMSVQRSMQASLRKKRDKQIKTETPAAESDTAALPFSFGPPRYASRGPRRLFLTQKCAVSPSFEPEVERPRAILRLRAQIS
jgi:7-keto-8-aminopelargonate synthetase-like enzyme